MADLIKAEAEVAAELAEPTDEDLKATAEELVVLDVPTTVRRDVLIPALTALSIRLVDSGPGGDPPFELQAIVGDPFTREEAFTLVEALGPELAAAVEKARQVLAFRYRERVVGPQKR